MGSRKYPRVLFAASGIAPVIFLFFSIPTTLLYSVFVLLYFQKDRIASLTSWFPYSVSLLLFFVGAWVLGLTMESLFWSERYVFGEGDPDVDPVLFVHLGNYFWFYGAMAIAWVISLRIFKITPLQVFFTQGISGSIIEQHGAVLFTAIANPLGVLWLIYLFAVYGSFIAIPHLLFGGKINQQTMRDNVFKYPFVFVLKLILMLLIEFLAGFV